MWSLKQSVCLCVLAFFSAATIGSATAAPPDKVLDAYVKAYTSMGKGAAMIFNDNKTRANARTNMISTWADIQAKMINAKATWITAVTGANATNSKTLQTLEEVRGLRLDNSLKLTKAFYEKRALHDGYSGLYTRKRPTKEDLIRYSKASVPQRPGDHQLESVRGKIYWPEVFLQDQFSDRRIQLDCLFAGRKATPSTSGSNVSHEVQTVAGQMREQLRSKVRQMPPSEYVAARRFLESLAYEARFPARIEGVASN